MHRKGLVLFAYCFFATATNTFSQQFPFVYYTPKDGLINSRVQSIKQDSKGRMYFLTYGGLSVYDGSRFTNYNQQNGLATDLVNDIVELSPDSMLVATNSSTLNTLVHGKTGIYKTVDNFCPLINRFLKSKDGYWYVIGDDGLFKLADHRFTRLPVLDKQGIPISNMDRITEWDHYFLIIPWNGEQKEKLILYNKQTRKVTAIYTDNRVFSTAVNAKGELWISTSEGIKLIDTASLRQGIITLAPLPALYHAADWHNVHIFFDSNGNTWLYGNGQVVSLSAQGQEKIISAEQGLKTGNLADIFVDREGITWMASDGNGVVKMTGSNMQEVNTFFPGKASFITSIYQQGDTTWLSNTVDNSIYSISSNGLHSFPLSFPAKKSLNICLVNQDLYFSEVNHLFCVRDKDKASSYLHPDKILTDSTPVFEMGSGIVDRNGAFIENIKENDTSFYLFVLYHNKIQMRYNVSYAIDQMNFDEQGRLWVPTRDNHLLVFTLHPEDPPHYLQLAGDYAAAIKGMDPRAITIDKSGTVWIGTRYRGLYCLKFDKGQSQLVKQFGVEQGLTDNFIYCLHCDDFNNIWVGTQTGLDKIYLVNGQYVIDNVTKSKDIFRSIYKIITTGNKNIWALTSAGSIIQISPVALPVLPAAPPLLLTSLVVNDQPYPDSAHRFSHRQNNFSFMVAAPSFFDEKSIRYSYLLKGSGKNNWSEPSGIAAFNFINLAPGNYELDLKAEFPPATYPPQTLNYSFTVAAPFWQTWWFRILAAAMVIGLVYYMVRNHYRRVVERKQVEFEKQKALEKERTRIATDMHDDLGAGLSKIRFLSETVQRNSHEKEQQPNLQNIASSSVELVDKFNEIIWAMNEKNNFLEDLLYYIRNYTAKYCAENNLDYHISLPDNIPSILISGEMRRHIFLTVKEALHNVVKHAGATNVWLSLKIDMMITIIVRDDGKGFALAEMKNAGNGLRSMEQRISNIRGKLLIENKVGTSLTITVPVREVERG